MHLIFDTETTGKADFSKPATDPCQPDIIQLAALLYDDRRNLVAQMDVLTIPTRPTWAIDPGAEAIHHISRERVLRYGVPHICALSMFNAFCYQARTVASFNIQFDVMMIQAALSRLTHPKEDRFAGKKMFCVMREMTPICRIKSPTKPGALKRPKLQEAYRHCFNEAFSGAHGAMADTQAAARIYWWMFDNADWERKEAELKQAQTIPAIQPQE